MPAHTLRFGLSLALIAAATAATSGHAAVVNFEDSAGGDYRLDSITGLVVNGETYDVDFVHGGSWETVAASIDTPITFTTNTQALAALSSMVNAVNGLNQSIPSWNHLIGRIYVPYGILAIPDPDPDRIRYATTTRAIIDPLILGTSINVTHNPVTNDYPGSGASTNEWAIIVPEPGTAGVLALGAALALRRRRAA